MSAPPPAGGIHLLVADDALPEGHRSGIYLAVCGAMLHPSNLPSACCPEGCDCDLALYCPDCVCQAAEWVAVPRNVSKRFMESPPRGDDLDS